MVLWGDISLANFDTMSLMSYQKSGNRKTRLHKPGPAQDGGCQLHGRGPGGDGKSMSVMSAQSPAGHTLELSIK